MTSLWRRRAVFWLAFACGALPAAGQQGDRVPPEIVTLPLVIEGKPTDVVAHLYKPPGDGPFPLVIYSHGRAGNRIDRVKMEYPVPVGHGNYWLRKGVALLAPMRPGYGATGGTDLEDSGVKWNGAQCYTDPDFMRVALNARRTVRAAYDWAMQQPWVRKDRVLLQGQSVGGMTTVAAGALNLPGVVGVVNFAGGSGGYPEMSPGRSCKPELLTETYRQLGTQVKAPSLWLYAPNDLYWGEEMPKAWHEAFKSGGSDTEFVMTARLEGRDGHQLLLHGGRMWSVPLDAFIKRVGLTAP